MSDTLIHGVPDLFTVEQAPVLWLRGGQPTPEGWGYLAGQGVKVVVKLNTNKEASDQIASRLGMEVNYFPIPWWRQVLLRPRQSTLVAAVKIILTSSSPVFIHCQHGDDRTGLIIGCLRLAQGWSIEDAFEEMEAHDFHLELQGLYGAWLRQRPEDWVELCKPCSSTPTT